MSARHRQAKKLFAARAELAIRASTNLARGLRDAGALCAAYDEGRKQEWRRLTVSPGWIWEPGCKLAVCP